MMNSNSKDDLNTFINKENDIKNPGQNAFEVHGRNTYYNSLPSYNNGRKNTFFYF